jgi:zinc protease
MDFKGMARKTLAAAWGILVVYCCFPVSGEAMVPIKKLSFPNKLTCFLSEEHSLPFVTLQMLIEGGSRKDPAGKEGLAHLTAKTLLLGTRRLPVRAIDEALDFMGAELHTSAGRDYITVNLRVLKKDLEAGLRLFVETLTQPAFPEEEVSKETKKILGLIHASEERPGVVAEKAFNRTLFRDSPYRHPVEGTREAVSRLTRADILRFYQDFYHPENAVLSIVGDITAAEVTAMVAPLLANWPAGTNPGPLFNPGLTKKEGETVLIDRDLTQANIIIGGIGVERSNPDYYALTVMNYILGGGGFSSRLMEEIRVKRGLAYSVSSFLDAQKYQGSYQIVLQTKTLSAREALGLALKQMEVLRQEAVSEDTLERAKKYLVGSFPMRFDTQKKLASFLSLMAYYDLGLDYPEKYPALIKAVSREDVLRVARKYLIPEKTVRVIVGNLKESRLQPPAGSGGYID